MIYILYGFIAVFCAVGTALLGVFGMGAVAQKGAETWIGMTLLIGGPVMSLLIAGLFITGAVLGAKGHDPAWLAHVLMLSGIPLLLLFFGIGALAMDHGGVN